MQQTQVTGVQYGKSIYPVYDSAYLGFRNFWYPVLFSHQLRRKPVALTLLGEKIVFFREKGKVYALHNRCPHRGVCLDTARREFPGTITCVYHGWTFDLKSGKLVAALTDGPDSPICGKVSVRTYPVEERLGLIWIFIGDIEPPPVEEDIPDEWLQGDTVIVGRITEREGDWRHAAENGFDEGHAKYLHRNSLWVFFRKVAAWSDVRVSPTEDGRGVKRLIEGIRWAVQDDFPGLGKWPQKMPFWRRASRPPDISISLPGVLRVAYREPIHYEWYVATVPGRHRYLQFLIKRTRGWGAIRFRLLYWLLRRWVFHVRFNNQDAWMVRQMQTPPERLYRPDLSIVAWRKLCETLKNGKRGGITPDQQPRLDVLEEDGLQTAKEA